MQIDFKAELAKHNSSIRINSEFSSNVNASIFDDSKHLLPRTCRERGTQSSVKEEPSKHESSILIASGPASNIQAADGLPCDRGR
jgi:hypothetical protein